MKSKNSSNLVKCDCCSAIYDKTLSWVRGYYEGTSSQFIVTGLVGRSTCPICGKKH